MKERGRVWSTACPNHGARAGDTRERGYRRVSINTARKGSSTGEDQTVEDKESKGLERQHLNCLESRRFGSRSGG